MEKKNKEPLTLCESGDEDFVNPPYPPPDTFTVRFVSVICIDLYYRKFYGEKMI